MSARISQAVIEILYTSLVRSARLSQFSIEVVIGAATPPSIAKKYGPKLQAV